MTDGTVRDSDTTVMRNPYKVSYIAPSAKAALNVGGLCEHCQVNEWHFITDYYDYAKHKRRLAHLCGPCQQQCTEMIDSWLGRKKLKSDGDRYD